MSSKQITLGLLYLIIDLSQYIMDKMDKYKIFKGEKISPNV